MLLAVYGLAQLRPVPAEPASGAAYREDVASPASLRRPASSSPAAIQCGPLSARGLREPVMLHSGRLELLEGSLDAR